MNIDYVPVSLPSKCLVYKDVDPSNVRIRPFTGRDEQVISELNLRSSKKHLLKLVENIIQGVPAEQITTGDLSYILVWEGINSYTNLFPLRLICQGCQLEVEVKIDLNNLEKKELPNEFKQPYSVKLPVSKKEVFLRLLTLKDDIEILNFESNGRASYLYSYALSIVDENTSAVGRVQVLESMSPKDLAEIRKFHIQFEHGPDFNTSYTCPKCGWEGEVLIPFRLEDLILEVSKP